MGLKTRILNFFRIILWNIPIADKILVFFSRGKSVDHFIIKILPNPYQFSIPFYKECCRFDLNWRLDLSQLLEWHLYFGIIEPDFEVLFKQIDSSQIIIDIGANFGFPSFVFAKLVSKSGKVYSFEPFPANFEKLKSNLELNSHRSNSINETIEIFPFAIGEVKDEITMICDSENNNAQAKLNKHRKMAIHEKSQPKIIQQTSLDIFAQEHKISSVDIIKVDVEGYEVHVLRGAKSIIEKSHPLIFIEVSDELLKNYGESAWTLLETLRSFGYKLFHLPSLAPVDSQNPFISCHMNILAKFRIG